ncbi:hypothetical protein PSH25_005821, partial [Micromonospora sp. PSH25]|nr:hypothetical protein [Micromonospora foliorum]
TGVGPHGAATGAGPTGAATGIGPSGKGPTGGGLSGTGPTGTGPSGDSAGPTRRGPWRRGRAILTVGGAVIAAVALAGSLGDFSNRRQGQSVAPTGSGPGTTTVGMPRTEEPTDGGDTGPSATRNTPSATRTGPPTGPGGIAAPAPTTTTAGPTPTGATPTPTPAAGVPVDARGGTVTVRCVGSLVEVVAVVLAPDFRAEAYDPGPARQVVVELTSAEYRSEIRAQCPDGQLRPKVKERAA